MKRLISSFRMFGREHDQALVLNTLSKSLLVVLNICHPQVRSLLRSRNFVSFTSFSSCVCNVCKYSLFLVGFLFVCLFVYLVCTLKCSLALGDMLYPVRLIMYIIVLFMNF